MQAHRIARSVVLFFAFRRLQALAVVQSRCRVKIYLVLIPLALACLLQPAAARPRDEVMSGAFRCGVIGDERTWLDCYYGAAQPVRAPLGLPPAPARQTSLISTPPASLVVDTDLSRRNQAMSDAVRCMPIGNERKWLDYYYGAVLAVRVELGLASGVPIRRADPIASATPSRQSEITGKPGQGIPDSVDHSNARMISYSFDKLGWFTVTLDNGQVWAQVHGDTDFAHWKRPAADYRVRLSHGFLNSYILQIRGELVRFKVRQQ